MAGLTGFFMPNNLKLSSGLRYTFGMFVFHLSNRLDLRIYYSFPRTGTFKITLGILMAVWCSVPTLPLIFWHGQEETLQMHA